MKIKAICKHTICWFMHVNKVMPLMKMAYSKPKRHLFTSLSGLKKSWNKTICLQTHFREISLSAIHHQSSVSSTTSMHRYQPGEKGQPVKIQELRTFLQTNIVRSSDTDKMHFSHCWLRLCQMPANISSLNLEQTFYILTYSPTPLYLDFSPKPFLRNCGLQPIKFVLLFVIQRWRKTPEASSTMPAITWCKA